jgi:hypothetical protein
MRIDRPRPLTAAQQYLNLRSNPICAGVGTLRAGRLLWRFSARPTLFSRDYTARIDYWQGGTPRVFVEDPDLTALAEGRRLPHVHQQKPTQLCLYLPGAGEWTARMRIDQTLVPWTFLWLFYFEEWLDSDDWKGGGVHPGDAESWPRCNPSVPLPHLGPDALRLQSDQPVPCG